MLHPLPRLKEINEDLDENPKAYYFEQAHNGLFARQALIIRALGYTLEDVKANDALWEEIFHHKVEF